MSLDKFKSVSPDQLADDLTKFLYSRDYSFAQGKTDVTNHSVLRESRTYVDSDGDDVLVPNVTERLGVSAARNIFIQNWQKAMPSDFSISHRRTSFVDTVPGQLRHILDEDILDQYDNTEPGDLNEVHRVDYSVLVDPDGFVSIGRDISYQLRDIKHAVYKARESKLPKTQKVHVASENDTLTVRVADLPEEIDDPGLQALVGIDFCFLTMNSIADFEQNWVDVEVYEQIACVNALMNSLITGRPVKKAA